MSLQIDVLNPLTYGEGDPATNGMPWAQYEWLRENAPCYRQKIDVPLLFPEAWVFSRYEDVALIDRDTKRFTSEFGPTLRTNDMSTRQNSDRPVMMSIDGPDHIRNRKVVSRGLKATDVAALEPRIRELCDELLDFAARKRTVEFMSEVGSKLPLQVICELVGIPEGEKRREFHDAIGIIGHATNPDHVLDPMRVVGAAQFVWGYATELAGEKRGCPADDLMSRVVEAHDSERLSEKEVEAMLLMLGLGGDETTRNALGHGLFAFHNFPDQWELLCSDPERYVDTAVEEVLRWATPVVAVRRTVTEDVEFYGQTIREGELVSALYASANFDPGVFGRPYEFDITRARNRHLSFGNGPHVCLGAALGRLEIRCFLLALVERMEGWTVPTGITYLSDSFLRPVKRLDLEFQPRASAAG